MSVSSCSTSLVRFMLILAFLAIMGIREGFMLVRASITVICSSVIHFSKTLYSAQSGVIL